MSGADDPSTPLDRVLAGDRAALVQLLLDYYDELRQHVESRISPRLQGLVRADDVMQQTFVRAVQGLSGCEFRSLGAFRGWLRTIADNLVRDAEKRRRRERRLPAFVQQWFAADSADQPHQEADQLPGSMTSPSGHVQRREAVQRMQAALADLPDDQREVVRRRYLLGQSLDEIAEATGRTRAAVRGLCFRGRQSLRVAMGRSSLYFSH
jgi:RNA polymerase sigma-70 factor (ECF subfamily)